MIACEAPFDPWGTRGCGIAKQRDAIEAPTRQGWTIDFGKFIGYARRLEQGGDIQQSNVQLAKYGRNEAIGHSRFQSSRGGGVISSKVHSAAQLIVVLPSGPGLGSIG